MVAAADHKAKITVEEVDEGIARATCDSCEWMEVGTKAHIGRKGKKHVEEHRSATSGVEEGIPTIYDAIQGLDLPQQPTGRSVHITGGAIDLTPEGAALLKETYFPERREEVLARLESCAGASDQDREAWLAERTQGVTATEVAKLARNYDTNSFDIINEKLYGSTFKGNHYTRWGKEREPYLEQVGLERFGIYPESRVFKHPDEPRHLASPDGIQVNGDGLICLGEYKTCGKDLTLALLVEKGYWDQAQWQMYVLGAESVWLIWEWREGPEGAYTARPGGLHLIERDDARIDLLVTVANRFLGDLDEARAQAEKANEPPSDPWLQGLLERYLDAKEALKECDEALRDYLTEMGITKVETDVAMVSYSLGSPRKSFDSQAFREDNPDLWDKYQKVGEAPTERTMRVTAR